MSVKNVSIELTHSEALVLFDFLTRFNENDNRELEDPAERRVLWDIESILEKSLVEPLVSDYERLIKQARKEVRSESRRLDSFQK